MNKKKDAGEDRIPDAYDVDGRPLFYHPPEEDFGEEQIQNEPVINTVDADMYKLKHDRSIKDFPEFDLADDEYVEQVIYRHKFGESLIWLGTIGVLAALAVLWGLILTGRILSTMAGQSRFYIILAILVAMAVTVVVGAIGLKVYRSNKMVVTNKRVMQRIVLSLFSMSMQTIDLGSIEDISYKQNGILQQMFNYGTLRLSTVGDETTYTFTFVTDPAKQVRNVSKIVQGFKLDVEDGTLGNR